MVKRQCKVRGKAAQRAKNRNHEAWGSRLQRQAPRDFSCLIADCRLSPTLFITSCHSPASPSKTIMPTVTRLLSQHLVQVDSGQLTLHKISESNLIEEQDELRTMLERNEGRALGLAGTYSSTGELA